MSFDHLADFLSQLADDGELLRISAEVDPVLELAAITERACKLPGGGPALLFDNVKGHSVPVVTNLLGSERRMCRALRADSFDDVARRIVGLIQPDVPDGWLEALKLIPGVAQLTNIAPKTVKSAICQQVVRMGRDVDLGALPIPWCWPYETGPTLTAGQVFTLHPQSGIREVGLSPLEVIGRETLAIHWTPHDDAWEHFAEWKQSGQMPVAVALGGDPALLFAAAAPLPPHTDACRFAGFLRNENIELVKCRSIDLEVPAHAEIVIEGHLDPSTTLQATAGIGCPTGFYGPAETLPVMRVTAVTQRSNPVLSAMICGPPPMEDFWFGRACERIFLPLVRLFVPEVVDHHMPRAGVFRNLLFVSIRKSYPQQARKVMNALWGLGRLSTMKMIVVVDADVDVHDEEQVWYHVGANVHPGRDTIFCEGPTHMLDHAAPVRGLGHKLGIDATRKLPEEGHPRVWPAPLQTTAEIRELVGRRWSEYGFAGPTGEGNK